MKKRRNHRTRRAAALFLILTVVLCFMAEKRLAPLVRRYAAAEVERNATLFINEAVTNVLADESSDLKLMEVTEDADGNVRSVRANVAAINLLKSRITTEILRLSAEKKNERFSLPLGTVLGGSLLSGRGPSIPIRVSIGNSVMSTLFSEFEAAGINQTNHRLYIRITARFVVAIPVLCNSSVEVTTAFLVAENVLVGTVPESFTVVDDSWGDLL